MSTWFEPTIEDMAISKDGKELDVVFDSDYNGNLWISLKIEDIKKLLAEHTS